MEQETDEPIGEAPALMLMVYQYVGTLNKE